MQEHHGINEYALRLDVPLFMFTRRLTLSCLGYILLLFVKPYMTEDPLRRSLLNSNSPLLLCSGLPTKPLLGGGVKIRVEVRDQRKITKGNTKPLMKILDITHLQVQPTDVFCRVLMPQDLGSTHPSKMTNNNNPSLHICLWSTAMETIIL